MSTDKQTHNGLYDIDLALEKIIFSDPHPHWKFSFQFWAFKTKMPGTVAYSVGEAGNPERFMVFQDTNANKNGWTHRFTFWAYPSQLALDRALNL